MAVFGVEPLDGRLDTLPPHNPILLRCEPGVESDPFLHQAVREAVEDGQEVVYVTTVRAPRRVREALVRHGLEKTGAVRFLDAHAGLVGVSSPEDRALLDLQDPQALILALEELAREHPDALLVVADLGSLVDQAGAQRFLEALPGFVAAARSFRRAIVHFADWGHEQVGAALRRAFDHVVGLYTVQERVVTNQYFRLERVHGEAAAEARPCLFRTDSHKGVYVYIPKVLVTGNHNAGKTTFVHTVSDRAVSTERMGTTVALDRGRVQRHGLVVDIFGSPGQARFDPLLVPLMKQAVGFIHIVDATDPASFDRARELLDRVRRTGRPVVLAVNKQDDPDALSPDEVAGHLGAAGAVPAQAVVASDRASADRVLDLLVDRVLHGGEARITGVEA